MSYEYEMSGYNMRRLGRGADPKDTARRLLLARQRLLSARLARVQNAPVSARRASGYVRGKMKGYRPKKIPSYHSRL